MGRSRFIAPVAATSKFFVSNAAYCSVLRVIPRSVSQQVRSNMRGWSCFMRPQETLVFWGILTRTRIPHPSSRSLSQERRVLTHCASSKSATAEAGVCSFRNCSEQGVNRPPFKMAEKTYFPRETENPGLPDRSRSEDAHSTLLRATLSAVINESTAFDGC